jgi:hypothetical protein
VAEAPHAAEHRHRRRRRRLPADDRLGRRHRRRRRWCRALFAIIFIWTPPHFWALALLGACCGGDYARRRADAAGRSERSARRSLAIFTPRDAGMSCTADPDLHDHADYFEKIQCFCFDEQRLAPGESRDMGVMFFVNPDLVKDPSMRDVRTITLSYTMFRKPDVAAPSARSSASDAAEGPRGRSGPAAAAAVN